MTPFKALYGYEPPKWKEFALSNTKLPAVKNQLAKDQKVIHSLKENLAIAHNRMKQEADQHRGNLKKVIGYL